MVGRSVEKERIAPCCVRKPNTRHRDSRPTRTSRRAGAAGAAVTAPRSSRHRRFFLGSVTPCFPMAAGAGSAASPSCLRREGGKQRGCADPASRACCSHTGFQISPRSHRTQISWNPPSRQAGSHRWRPGVLQPWIKVVSSAREARQAGRQRV